MRCLDNSALLPVCRLTEESPCARLRRDLLPGAPPALRVNPLPRARLERVRYGLSGAPRQRRPFSTVAPLAADPRCLAPGQHSRRAA